MKSIILYCTCVFLLLTGTGFSEGTAPSPSPSEDAGRPTVKFHHQGIIERITDERIVLNDTSLMFSSKIEFYSGKGKRISRYDFHEGEKVGCRLDEKGKVAQLRKILPD